MPRSSRTPYAILGALSHGPKSGYDISRLFEKDSMFFWNESYGQIYPTLKKLRSKGFVTMERDERDVGPDRKVYTLTDDGRSELERWLRQPASPHSVRDEYLLKLFFAQPDRPTVALANLEKLSAEIEDTLDGLAEDRSELEESKADITTEAYTFQKLAIEWSKDYHEAKLEWCQKAIDEIVDLRG